MNGGCIYIPSTSIGECNNHESRYVEISEEMGIGILFCPVHTNITAFVFDDGIWSVESAQTWVRENGEIFEYYSERYGNTDEEIEYFIEMLKNYIEENEFD